MRLPALRGQTHSERAEPLLLEQSGRPRAARSDSPRPGTSARRDPRRAGRRAGRRWRPRPARAGSPASRSAAGGRPSTRERDSRGVTEWSAISSASSGPFLSNSRRTKRLKRAFASGTRSSGAPTEYLPRRLAHPRVGDREVVHQPDVGTPLEQLPFLPEQPVEVGELVRAKPAPRTSCCGGATVEIGSICSRPSSPDRVEHARRRPVEELRSNRDPPRLVGRDEPCWTARARDRRAIERAVEASSRRDASPSSALATASRARSS